MKPSEYSLNDPVAAIATALVPSALGIVRASGRGSIELLATLFSRPDALLSAGGNTLVHGWILDAEAAGGACGARAGDDRKKIDEVMVAIYRAPRSFTGEDSVEIIGHGGTAAVLAVYRACIAAGFRPAERGEFTFRSFANGHTDLARSEAIREIIGAETDKARERAAGRLSGNLSSEVTAIKDMILRALAAIEVEIEYPEDEETTKGAFDAKAIASATERLAALESSWAAEKLYQDGARVVLAGRTNAGKSSLFNAFLKEDRAIVSDIHGTTRDWLESAVDFDGIPVRIFDTAGLRETSDVIEAEGVERSKVLAKGADLVLYLVDGTEGLNNEDREFLSTASDSTETVAPGEESPVILVWNKADREGSLPAPDTDSNADPEKKALCVAAIQSVSAKRGTGISDLVHKASAMLVEGRNGSGSAATRTASLGTERQKIAIRSSISCLEHALQAAAEGFPMDAIAQDLEDSLAVLGEVTGEVTSADILDTVFSGFCVGK